MTVSYRPSNGSEGDWFIAKFCENCRRDRAHNCSILARTMAYNIEDKGYPKEWVADDDYTNARCTAFVHKDTPPKPRLPSKRKAVADLFTDTTHKP